MAAPKVSGTRVILEGSYSTTASLAAPTREVGNGLQTRLWLQSTAPTPATPSGWVLLAAVPCATKFKEWIYARIGGADGTATDNFATSWTGSTFRFAEMRRITGNSTNVGDWLVGTPTSGTGTTATFTGLKTVSAENLLLGDWNTAESSSVKSVTEGWVLDGAIWTPTHSKELLIAGETGALEIVFTGAEDWAGVMIAIPPPPAGAPSTPRPGSLGLLGVGR